MRQLSLVRAAIGTLVLVLFGCDYDVPITAKPTRRIDERLVGNWTNTNGKDRMRVLKYDDFHYAVSSNGDLFRAYHSDISGGSFITVQDINSADRKFFYVMWRLSADGNTRCRYRASMTR